MIRLIVLDCDGVMFDSKESNVRYYNDALRIFGYPPMTREEETYSHMATADGALTHIFRNYREELQQIKETLATKLTYSNYARYMRMEPDLPDFLAQAVIQCAPEETLFVGDSVLDKMQAAACGVELVAFKNRELDAKYHVNTFMEILSLPQLSVAD